jgi:hypothetical protein
MNNLLRKTLIKTALFLGVIIAILGGLLYRKHVYIIPFPYEVAETPTKIYRDSLKQAQEAQVLIVGDRMGVALNSYIPMIKSELEKELKTAPAIYNWSRPHEGLHRTLNKIKSLKKVPPIVIYHGSSEEWYETKFNPKDSKKILSNFQSYENEKIISLIITFPDLSRWFYKNVDIQYLNNLPLKPTQKNESNFKIREVEYKLFDHELKELIEYLKQKKSNLIILSDPINLFLPPKLTCPETITTSLIEIQQDIEDMMKNGNYKMAYTKSLELSKESVANARTFYLLGTAASKNADLKTARESLVKSNVYDCQNYRGNFIFNAIMQKNAQKSELQFIDFASLTANAELSNGEVFLDEIYPQNKYYQLIMEDLLIALKKYLDIKGSINGK